MIVLAQNAVRDITREALHRGATGVEKIEPKKHVVVKPWVRLKCRFGCNMYESSWVCPPHTLSFEEAVDFFRDYEIGLLFKFTPPAPHTNRIDYVKYKNWTKVLVAGLERRCRDRNLDRAFALHSGPCTLCWSVKPNGLIKYRLCTLHHEKELKSSEAENPENPSPESPSPGFSKKKNAGIGRREALRSCRFPGSARPAMEALCVDVFRTVENCGWSASVCTSRHQIPTYYSMLLIE